MSVFFSINKLYSCLHPPLFFIFILLLCVLALRKKDYYYYLIGTIVILFVWRCFVSAHSSRYYSVFLIVFGIIFAFCYRDLFYNKSRTWIHRCLFAFLLFAVSYNTIKCFIGFPNNYLFDISETIQNNERTNEYSYALIPTKEYHRVGVNVSNKFYYEIPLIDLVKEYSLWGEDLLVLSFDKNNDIRKQPETNIKIIQKHKRSSDSKQAFLYLYSPPRHQLSSDNRFKGSNLIANGNIELIQDPQKTKTVLKSWINAGDKYYDSPHKRLPEHHILLPHWAPFEPDCFPEVYVDETNPINGKYSLRICNKERNNHIFFLNEFKSVPGCFSFLVKNKANRSIFNIRRYDYRNDVSGPITPNDSNRYILLHDESIYRIAITTEKDDFVGDRSLYFVAGKNFDILVDDIVYSPQ